MSESCKEADIPDPSDRSGPECHGVVWRFGRNDRAVGLFAPDQPSTVEPPVSAPEAGACNAPRVPEYPRSPRGDPGASAVASPFAQTPGSTVPRCCAHCIRAVAHRRTAVLGQPVPRSSEEFRKVEMMHGVEGGHEVVTAGLELETFRGRAPRLDLIDHVGAEQPVDLLQHRWGGIDAGEREIRDRPEHPRDAESMRSAERAARVKRGVKGIGVRSRMLGGRHQAFRIEDQSPVRPSRPALEARRH